MGAFTWGGDREKDKKNDAFQDWLAETCAGDLSAEEREESRITSYNVCYTKLLRGKRRVITD